MNIVQASQAASVHGRQGATWYAASLGGLRSRAEDVRVSLVWTWTLDYASQIAMPSSTASTT
eukprot:4960647-Amphidinium_carterae.1